MQHIHSPRFIDHAHVFRQAVMNGIPVPAQTAAVLEARGINIADLEQRIRFNMGFKL